MHSYSLVDGDGGEDNDLFQVIDNQIQFMNSPDFEIQSSYFMLLQTTYSNGSTHNYPIILLVDDINESPTALIVSSSKFDENLIDGSNIATLRSIDVDAEDSHTYALVDGEGDDDNSAFTLESDKLIIRDSPDFETKPSYSIRLKTTDSGGLSFEKASKFRVNDLKEALYSVNK